MQTIKLYIIILKFAIAKLSGISLSIPMETFIIQSNTVKHPSTREHPVA